MVACSIDDSNDSMTEAAAPDSAVAIKYVALEEILLQLDTSISALFIKKGNKARALIY
jgi:hypothetical protein